MLEDKPNYVSSLTNEHSKTNQEKQDMLKIDLNINNCCFCIPKQIDLT